MLIPYDEAKKVVPIALKQLEMSQDYKRPRRDRLREYVNLANGKIQPRIRQQYNIPLPIMPGLIDALESDFDDPFELEFDHRDPADYFKVKKINAAWKADSSDMGENGMWNIKDTYDKHCAIISGRGVQKTYAESDPEYKSHFDIVHWEYFENEPKGGGILDRHLFMGETGLFKTRTALEDGVKAKIYYPEAAQRLIEHAGKDYKAEAAKEYENKFAKYRALGLDPEGYNFVGEELFNETEWIMNYKGKRYYLVFDAFTRTPVRCEYLKDVFSNNKGPWTSWATHPDLQVFDSKSYCDDFYPVCMSIIELMNQEMSARSKKLLGGRAFDSSMFPDVAKLDAASYRPDALVPVDTKGGTRKIADGIYEFKTDEFQGTINLANWLKGEVGDDTGVNSMSTAGQGKGGKRNQNLVLVQLQQAEKRIGHKAKNYTVSRIQIGERWLNGLEDNLTESMMVEMIGEADAYGWDYLNRGDLRLSQRPRIKVASPREKDKQNIFGKDQKTKGLEMIGADPLMAKTVNPKWRAEQTLRDVAGYEEDALDQAFDLQGSADPDLLAEADVAISKLLKGKMPDIVYDATTEWAEKILKFERAHQVSLSEKKIDYKGKKVALSMLFFDYIQQHTPIIQQNMQKLASKQKAAMAMSGDSGGGQKPSASKNPVARQNPGAQAAPVRKPMRT